MAVYVDPLFDHGRQDVPRCFRNVQSCHMYADSLAELHAFARRLGLKREWFQNHPALAHYDLVPSRRLRAVSLGAIEQDRRAAVAKWREIRENQAR